MMEKIGLAQNAAGLLSAADLDIINLGGEMNTWPGGERHAIHQSEHESWNAKHYPGTLQLCSQCEVPTGRCEEDSIYLEDGTGPLCESCHHDTDEYKNDL